MELKLSTSGPCLPPKQRGAPGAPRLLLALSALVGTLQRGCMDHRVGVAWDLREKWTER